MCECIGYDERRPVVSPHLDALVRRGREQFPRFRASFHHFTAFAAGDVPEADSSIV
jgi:hypothetical protein